MKEGHHERNIENIKKTRQTERERERRGGVEDNMNRPQQPPPPTHDEHIIQARQTLAQLVPFLVQQEAAMATQAMQALDEWLASRWGEAIYLIDTQTGGATPDEIPTPDTLPWQPPPHQPHTTEHAQHPPHPPSQHHHTGPGGQGGQEDPTEEFTSPRSEPEEGRPDTLGGLQRRGSPLPDHDSRRRRTHEGASSD